jgi:hypothetical protein
MSHLDIGSRVTTVRDCSLVLGTKCMVGGWVLWVLEVGMVGMLGKDSMWEVEGIPVWKTILCMRRNILLLVR